MHPSKPLGWYLGAIIVHVDVIRIFHPTIASIEVIRILIIAIAVFIGANEATFLQFIESNYICSESREQQQQQQHKKQQKLN